MTKEFSPTNPDFPETKNPEAVEGTEPAAEMLSVEGEYDEHFSDSEISKTESRIEDEEESIPVVEETRSSSNTRSGELPQVLLDYQDAGFAQDLQDIVTHLKWKAPRQLDANVLPHALVGEDLLIQAASKTSAIVFLTLSHRLAQYKGRNEATEAPQAIVLYSSEEAASKACQDFLRLFGTLGLTASHLQEDPQSSEEESAETTKSVSNILFASPEAVKNALIRNHISLNQVQICICRDVDVMKDLGSAEDLYFIFSQTENSQKIFFTSTFSSSVLEIADKFLKNPKHISLERERATLASVVHKSYLCETPNKFKVLLGILKDENPNCTLVFTNSKLTAAWVYHKLLENSFAVEQLSSDHSPSKREEILEKVKDGTVKVLVATDYESRNLSIPTLTCVFNFDLPESADAYLHRMGQVGQHSDGLVVSLVCEEYSQNYAFVYELLGQKTPKPVWPKEEYSQIVDKSGNPFLEKNIFVEKRPSRDFGDRPRRGDGDRFPRKDRHERSDRSERPERSDRMNSRGPRIEERSDRGERDFTRGDRFERNNDRNDRPMRHERGEREDMRPRQSSGPQIKPRPRRMAHTPGGTQVRPIEPRGKIIKPAQKRGLLSKILSFFFGKKH